jgi:hypothetical protein
LSYPGIRLAGPLSNGSSSNTREEKIESITVIPKEEGVLPQVISLSKAVVHVSNNLNEDGDAADKDSLTMVSRSICPTLSTSSLGIQQLKMSY